MFLSRSDLRQRPTGLTKCHLWPFDGRDDRWLKFEPPGELDSLKGVACCYVYMCKVMGMRKQTL